MEKESFEDDEIAELLNKNFIPIKVDREERPDVDSVYMNVTQMMTGQGGWPMSVFLDNDARPFFAGTYFPKRDGAFATGFITVLERISFIWKTDRVSLFNNTTQIMEELTEESTLKEIDYGKTIEKCFSQLIKSFDGKYGGFGMQMKFPTPHNLLFLMRYYLCKKDADALAMVEKTLQNMYRGGIYDHLGFGFCRYSTDRMWLEPHFEKMLYDNALLAITYCEAYQCTKNPFYAKVAEEIFTYIKRDMTSEEGAFYSAEDADSEGEEGKFYIFTKEEILKLLGSKDGEKFCVKYNVTEGGNFNGANILNLISEAEEDDNGDFYDGCKKKLFDYREKRKHPFKDDKILTSWNGLMICAYAYGGRVLNNMGYIETAEAATEFILENMIDETNISAAGNGLYSRYRDGEAKFTAVADDYAYMIWGLIELYESTFNKKYLVEAYKLNAVLIENFWENGALFLTAKDSEQLIYRPREIYDGAIPSANSVSINNFIRLARLCGDHDLEEMAAQIIRFFGKNLEDVPHGHSFAMFGLMHFAYLSREIVLSGEKTDDFLSLINSVYSPFTVTAYVNDELMEEFEFYKNFKSNDKKPCAYVCENNICGLPIHEAEELKEKLS